MKLIDLLYGRNHNSAQRENASLQPLRLASDCNKGNPLYRN